MIDISTELMDGYLTFVKVLKIRFRFDYYPYLVADRFGNFFMLPHCPGMKSIPFKKLNVYLNGKTKSIKYHQRNVSLSNLRTLAKRVNEKYILPL